MSRSADAVDVHAHFFPETFLKVIADHGDVFGASIDRSSAKGPVIVMAGSRTPPLDASYWDLDRRLKAMNRQGVGVHALSLTVPMADGADGELGSRLAGAFNDALAQAHTAHPDRFVGGATLPMQSSDYCFDMGRLRRRDIVERQLKLSAADRARILSDTARRVLRL